MRKLRTTFQILSLLILFYALTIAFYAPPVFACHDPANRSADNNPPPNSGPCPAGLNEIEQVFSNVISVVVGLGFVAMLVMLVWAGITYLTSGGEPKAVQSAHQTVTWALLGVVFMAIAWLILQLIKVFTGIDVTIFNMKALCVGPLDALQYCKP